MPILNGMKIDKLTDAQVVVDYEHHEIHAGCHYVASFYQQDIGALSTTVNLLIKTGAKGMHLNGHISGDTAMITKFFEGASASANGTTITAFNSNRNSSNSNTGQFYSGPTVSATGTQMFVEYTGARNEPGMAKRENEFILKPNETYLMSLLSRGASLSVSGVFSWYEESVLV